MEGEYCKSCYTYTSFNIWKSFYQKLGGTDWDATDLTGEMTDPDGDDIIYC